MAGIEKTLMIELEIINKILKKEGEMEITILYVKPLNPRLFFQGIINQVQYHFLRNGMGYSENYKEFKNLEPGDKLNIEYDSSIKEEPSMLTKIERRDGESKVYPVGAAQVISMTYTKKSKI